MDEEKNNLNVEEDEEKINEEAEEVQENVVIDPDELIKETEEKSGRHAAEKKHAPIGLIIFLILILIIIAAAGYAYYWYTDSLKPISENSDEVVSVEIKSGSGVSGIASLLQENGLIKSDLAFKIYCKINNVTNLQAGEYEFDKGMNLESIVKSLQTGEVIDKTVNIIFKEGRNMRSVAKTISEKTSNSYDDVMKVFADKSYAKELINKYWFLTNEILDNDIYYPLEGYLYPDTYTLESSEVTTEEIIEKMLNHTDKILSEYKAEIKSSGYTVHKFLSLASVIENEGTNTADRKGIARVFLNRIKIGMALQSDVTTYYAFKINMGDRDLTREELNTYNKYNTRGPNMEGKIPVGPISNVSKSSIEALLNPSTDSKIKNALFFVADKNGKVYFSNTNAEHESIIRDLKNKGLWYTY